MDSWRYVLWQGICSSRFSSVQLSARTLAHSFRVMVHQRVRALLELREEVALLCAELYTRLGQWDDAETIATGLVDMGPGADAQSLIIIEAYRLLARCRSEAGDPAGACEACDLAEGEANLAQYLWMMRVVEKDRYALRKPASSMLVCG